MTTAFALHYVTAISAGPKEVLISCRCGELFSSSMGYRQHQRSELERYEGESK